MTRIERIMEIPKFQEGESLAKWQARLADEFNLDYQTQELLSVVSETAYVHGVNTILDTLKKEGRL